MSKKKVDNQNNFKKFNADFFDKDKNTESFVESKQVGIVFSKKIRISIFVLLALTNLIINMDHGTIPASTQEIKSSLTIDDKTLGVFGSLVFLGNLLGAVFFFSLVGNYNRKWIVVGNLLLTAFCMFAFVYSTSNILLFLNRILTGIFQSFLTIYFPVWCDQFGPKKFKGLMIALLQLGVPLGVVVGFGLTALIKSISDWKFSFQVQSLMIVGLSLIFIFIPRAYFSGTLQCDKQGSIIEKEPMKISIYNEIPDIELSKNSQLFENLKILLKNKLYIFCVLGMSVLYFIITAIQYWGPDYVKTNLSGDEKFINISFIFICITSPTFGIVLGGVILSKIGGVESKNSLNLCCFLSISALIFAVPIPFIDDIYTFSVFLWLVLFFGASLMPTLQGVIISSIPRNLRANGNSLNNFFCNLIGYLPAPFVYGYTNTHFQHLSPRIAMGVVMYLSLLGNIFIFFAMLAKKNTVKSENNLEIKSLTKVTHIANLFGSKIYNGFNIEDPTDEYNEEITNYLKNSVSSSDFKGEDKELNGFTNSFTNLNIEDPLPEQSKFKTSFIENSEDYKN